MPADRYDQAINSENYASSVPGLYVPSTNRARNHASVLEAKGYKQPRQRQKK